MSYWKEYLDKEVDKIYFDMDNTIADFNRGLKELCSLSPVPQELATPEQDDAMWAAIKNTDHFYYKLKKCLFGMQLLEKLRLLLGDKVEILTAIPKAKRGMLNRINNSYLYMMEAMFAFEYSFSEARPDTGKACRIPEAWCGSAVS